jgi:hypothetical protein
MCGTGLGFACERQYITLLPKVPEFKPQNDKHLIHVGDSKESWAFALQQLIAFLYNGIIPTWDLSDLRPAGARLMTFGGRSSGPEPLRSLFVFTVETFRKAQGRKLNSLEVHDLVCKIAEIVVVGGVRRCIPENALVFAKRGLIPIQDIVVGEEVLTASGYKKVLNKFKQGVQKLARITTQDGFFECTANHRMPVFDSCDTYIWKEASALAANDRLITNRMNLDGTKTSMPEWENIPAKSICRSISIPELDADMAWFIGLFHGDGSVKTKCGASISISFGMHEMEMVERARTQILRFNNEFNVQIYKLKNAECMIVECASMQLACYIHKNVKQSHTPLVIPDWILQSTADVKLGYLAGLMDSDGCVGDACIVATIYPHFARQVQILAYSCGLETRLRIETKMPKRGNYPMNYVRIVTSRTRNIFAAIPQLAKTLPTQTKTNYNNGFPSTFITDKYLRRQYRLDKSEQLGIDTYDATYDADGICPSKVKGVTPDVREAETWDIEVEEVHEFFVDGYLSHNSALISLSNLSDDRMRTAKSGEWWVEHPERALANNSVMYTECPEIGRFMKEWLSLYESKSGERGMINREAMQSHVRCKCPTRNPNQDFLVNPCGEIILPNKGLCNLTEVVIRADDTPATLRAKVQKATILGTWQCTLTDYKYVSPKWKENAEKERLLGVSLTGIMDNIFMSGRHKPVPKSAYKTVTYDSFGREVSVPKRTKRGSDQDDEIDDPWAGYTLPTFLEELRDLAIETNRIWADKLHINASVAITTVKPSGTVSQLVDSASGIHTRHARFYIRTVRGDIKDPLTTFLIDAGVPNERDVMKPNDTVVFSFPMEAPTGCITRDDQDVISQLEICKLYNEHWCQHKVSVTINVRESEWMKTGSWVWDNFDTTSGISFLPHSEHVYKQAPYQECTEEQYRAAAAAMPKINWKKLRRYETTDMTTGAKELACSAGGCEL